MKRYLQWRVFTPASLYLLGRRRCGIEANLAEVAVIPEGFVRGASRAASGAGSQAETCRIRCQRPSWARLPMLAVALGLEWLPCRIVRADTEDLRCTGKTSQRGDDLLNVAIVGVSLGLSIARTARLSKAVTAGRVCPPATFAGACKHWRAAEERLSASV